jgi:hypothetical protein
MSSPSSVLSQTLQSITTTKIRELRKQRDAFETRKAKVLEDYACAKDHGARIRVLLAGLGVSDVSDVSAPATGVGLIDHHHQDPELKNIHRFLDQSCYDPSISSPMLQDFAAGLRLRLDQQSRKFDYADLYSRLLLEWLHPSGNPIADSPTTDGSGSLDGAFQLVERDRLQQLRDKFEAVVFEPIVTDEIEIDNYMSSMFPEDDDEASRALRELRETVKSFGNDFCGRKTPFDLTVLRWCIGSLLKNDLLRDEQKSILEEFLTNDVALTEIADVLNMRFKDLHNWSWEAEDGMFYEPRRQLNGKYRIMMDEDILQAIFLHFIGITWSVALKRCFRALVANKSVWKGAVRMPREDLYRRQYFLGNDDVFINDGWLPETERMYEEDYLLCSLPNTVEEGAGVYEDDDRDDPAVKSANEIRQQLLRQLASEVIIRQSLHGEVAVVQSDVAWFAAGMPHSTVFALLRFFGVSETWIAFFRKFAEAPLRMSDAPGADVKIRKRGLPMAHASERLLGEVILFALDIVVNREAKTQLYRLHDDFWLCGEPAVCVTAWKTMKEFASLMGLEFNESKTGSAYITTGSKIDKDVADVLPKGDVRVGLLKLDAELGTWIIDQPQVDSHVSQLRKQLAACTSIFSWIQTWNSCIGRFFLHTFGEPANCFGRSHVDSVLRCHENIQRELFNDTDGTGDSVVEYLKHLIAERIGVCDVTDSFLFLPEELGGLGLRNPFLSFLVLRDQLCDDPQQRMKGFKAGEAKAYKTAKEDFEGLSELDKRYRFKTLYHDSYSATPAELKEFMTFEEYTRYRDTASHSLKLAYKNLMETPWEKELYLSRDVSDALIKVSHVQPKMSLSDLDAERKWIIQLYSADLFKRFGGLDIVDKGLLPLGVMTMLRSKNVTWQMVL